MRKTKSEPIQFRLLLDDYAILQDLAHDSGMTPKDYVIALTMEQVGKERRRQAREAKRKVS